MIINKNNIDDAQIPFERSIHLGFLVYTFPLNNVVAASQATKAREYDDNEKVFILEEIELYKKEHIEKRGRMVV